MSTDSENREAWARKAAAREAQDWQDGEQRRIAAYSAATALEPGEFVHHRVTRGDYQAAAQELRKLMGRS